METVRSVEEHRFPGKAVKRGSMMSHKLYCRGATALLFAVFLFLLSLGWPVRAEQADRGKVVYEAIGYIVPVRQVVVSPKVSGQIVELNIEEGKAVLKDEVLARLEAAEYQAELRVAKARLELAAAKLDRSKA